ncbi:hypothetical protein G7Y89_g10085 [Cudoniella acicularis]|uniref:2EXR domain-containing protein n=1 Tax=Cudoniella acicularis TaxID=354080 RepID=A0A8H4RFP8_9HELO|nr:hypothetical protein G7Y89_g10085 [Cudoniella acicularis]
MASQDDVQATPKGFVQVSQEIYNQAQRSLDDLQKEAANLREDNEAKLRKIERLKTESQSKEIDLLRRKQSISGAELERLQCNPGPVDFPHFPDLPPEIRRLIWDWSPQIHTIVFYEEYNSHSQAMDIMRSCREARAQGRKSNFSHYLYGLQSCQHGFKRGRSRMEELVSQFVHTDVDTIFFHSWQPEDFEVHCNNCSWRMKSNDPLNASCPLGHHLY